MIPTTLPMMQGYDQNNQDNCNSALDCNVGIVHIHVWGRTVGRKDET
jgi:hypothetical protein